MFLEYKELLCQSWHECLNLTRSFYKYIQKYFTLSRKLEKKNMHNSCSISLIYITLYKSENLNISSIHIFWFYSYHWKTTAALIFLLFWIQNSLHNVTQTKKCNIYLWKTTWPKFLRPSTFSHTDLWIWVKYEWWVWHSSAASTYKKLTMGEKRLIQG